MKEFKWVNELSKKRFVFFRELPNYTVEEVALSTFQSTNIVGFDNKENDHLKKSEDIILCDLYKQWLCCLKNNEETYRLAVGAVIADKMRKAVKEKTGFSCSAGIGQNKVNAMITELFCSFSCFLDKVNSAPRD